MNTMPLRVMAFAITIVLSMLNAIAFATSMSISTLHSCSFPVGLAADPVRQMLFAGCVVYTDAGGVWAINTTTGDTKQVLDDSTCDSPTSIVVDSQTHAAYVACEFPSDDPSFVSVWRIDGYTFAATLMTTKQNYGSPRFLWIDPIENSLIVTCFNAVLSIPLNSTQQPPLITHFTFPQPMVNYALATALVAYNGPEWRLAVSFDSDDVLDPNPIIVFNKSMGIITRVDPSFNCGALAFAWDATYPEAVFAACNTLDGVIELNISDTVPFVQSSPHFMVNQSDCGAPKTVVVDPSSQSGPPRLYSGCYGGFVYFQDLAPPGAPIAPYTPLLSPQQCNTVANSIAMSGPAGSNAPVYVSCDEGVFKVQV